MLGNIKYIATYVRNDDQELNLKNKANKQNRSRIIDLEIMWRGKWENWGKGAGIKKYKFVGSKYLGGC